MNTKKKKEINFQSIFCKKEDIVTRNIVGDTLLVPIRGNLADMQQIFALNPTADFIWQQLDGKQNLDTIRQGLVSGFEVTGEKAEHDILQFIRELDATGLIEEVPAG